MLQRVPIAAHQRAGFSPSRRRHRCRAAAAAQPYAGCCGLMFMCWGCPSRPMRCFCFLCSVIWKQDRKHRLLDVSSHLSNSCPRPLSGPRSPAASEPRSLTVDSPHRSVRSKSLREVTAEGQPQIYLLTKAAEYQLLIMKLGHMKFQRSSKVSES